MVTPPGFVLSWDTGSDAHTLKQWQERLESSRGGLGVLRPGVRVEVAGWVPVGSRGGHRCPCPEVLTENSISKAPEPAGAQLQASHHSDTSGSFRRLSLSAIQPAGSWRPAVWGFGHRLPAGLAGARHLATVPSTCALSVTVGAAQHLSSCSPGTRVGASNKGGGLQGGQDQAERAATPRVL